MQQPLLRDRKRISAGISLFCEVDPVKIYGTMQCPDCVQIRKDLDERRISYEFLDISENLLYLKEFLGIRDREPLFEPVKAQGKIGVPCIVHDDGSVALEW